MLFQIITLGLLITLCSGEYHRHNMKPSPSKHAISYQSFHREDVPLSYKYQAVHIYTTPKSVGAANEPHISKYHKPSAEPVVTKNIQYAPLDPTVLHNQLQLHKSHETPTYVGETTLRKDHLEPRYVTNKPEPLNLHSVPRLDYIPGHNIEVMKSVNRIPGHNAVYKTYPDTANAERLNKINYLRQYILYSGAPSSQPPRILETTTTTTEYPKPSDTLLIPIQQYAIPPKQYSREAVQQQSHKSPYTKMHALFLNVARTYNFLPHVPASLHTGANPAILGKTPTHTEALIRVPGSSKLEAPPADKKTLIFPIQKNRHFAIHV